MTEAHEHEHEAHDCARVLARLHQFLDGECAEAEADEIRQHLDACDRCVEDADTVLTLKALVRRCCRHTTAPDDLRVRLTARYSRVSITRVDYVEFRPPAPPA